MAAAVGLVAMVGTAFAALTWSSPVTIDPAAQLSWNDGGPSIAYTGGVVQGHYDSDYALGTDSP
jgi:hypothetical protein